MSKSVVLSTATALLLATGSAHAISVSTGAGASVSLPGASVQLEGKAAADAKKQRKLLPLQKPAKNKLPQLLLPANRPLLTKPLPLKQQLLTVQMPPKMLLLNVLLLARPPLQKKLPLHKLTQMLKFMPAQTPAPMHKQMQTPTPTLNSPLLIVLHYVPIKQAKQNQKVKLASLVPSLTA